MGKILIMDGTSYQLIFEAALQEQSNGDKSASE